MTKNYEQKEAHARKIEIFTTEIIKRYEEKLELMRIKLAQSEKEIVICNQNRRKAEERMRQTLLQGMTAMNMDTIHIFNDTSTNDNQINSD